MAEVGALYVREGKPQIGALAYQTALSNIADMTAEQCTTIGIGLYHAGNLSESSEAYRMAVTVDSIFTDAHAYLGWNLMLGEKTDEAIRHLERARSQRPSPAALFNLGFSYLRAGQVDVARSVYREGVELFGAQSGEEAQAPENLRWLIRRDLHAGARDSVTVLGVAGLPNFSNRDWVAHSSGQTRRPEWASASNCANVRRGTELLQLAGSSRRSAARTPLTEPVTLPSVESALAPPLPSSSGR
jgi:tetratricopeptide (TPR) repeat protein